MQKNKHPVKRLVHDVQVLNRQPHRHWHYVYRHRRARRLTDDVSTWQIVAGQVFTVVASIFAGLILDIQKENIGFIVGAFVLMPGIVDLSASLTGAMAAKINHQIDETPAHPLVVAAHSVVFALFIGVFAGTIVGGFGALLGVVFFDADAWRLMALGIFSMAAISVLTDPFVALLTVLVKRLGMNPDNIVGPIQSSLIDMIAIMVIATFARLLR